MCGGKFCMVEFDVVRCFADDFKIAYHRILRFLVFQKGDFARVFKVAVNALYRFEDVLAKLDEEVAELKAELSAPEPDQVKIGDELGDLLFTIVQVARWQNIDAEDALRTMLARFSRRFRYIETRAQEQGRSLPDMTLAEMDALWDEAKLNPNI